MEKNIDLKNRIRAVHVSVYGRVQGVGFRYWTAAIANRLGVKGFVKNLPDSSVEIAAETDAAVLNEFLLRLKHGPPYARVEQLSVEEIEAQGFKRFKIEG